MENKGGAHLTMDIKKMESSRASDLASMNLIGSNDDSEEKRGEGYGTISEFQHAKSRDGIRNEWLKLEVSYSDIKGITANFSEDLLIGEGGFGKVYRANLHGQKVAIKILDSASEQGEREFFQEIEVLYKLQHRNLVKLVGACFEVVRALIYEYLPNGSLEDCLENSPEILTWQIRTRIIYEICSGLSYLHSKHVVHADLKPANVLLNASFKSKLSDFGLCRLLPENMLTTQFLETKPMGTLGYTDPWFLKTCILRPGSDLFSLGVIVLRLLTRMSPVELAWQIRMEDENSRLKMIDSTAGNWPFELVKEMIYCSLQCCFHNENSYEVLMGMSNRLKRMLADIDTLQGERFEFRQIIQDGFGGFEPPSRQDKKEVIGATNPSSSSFFSEPQPPTQDGLSVLEPSTSNINTRPQQPPTQDGLSTPEPSTSVIDTRPQQPPTQDVLSAPEPSTSIIGTRVEERDGEKLVQFGGGSFVFSLDDGFSYAARRLLADACRYWRLRMLTMKDGNRVALKTIKEEFAKGRMEFEEEANALEKIRHPNLWAVRGYYIQEQKGIVEKSLVLECMRKGTLYSCLHCDGGDTKIDWPTRMNIAVGIARGLDYIHNDIKVIHGNFRSENIFLDDNANAKISDYELPRLTAAPLNSLGAFGYRAPELISSRLNKANTKSDVYSLGVILLELLTGKDPSKPLQGKTLLEWAAYTMKKKGPHSVLDRGLVSDASGGTNEQVATLLLALDCVNSSPGERPEVNQVLDMLEVIEADIHATTQT